MKYYNDQAFFDEKDDGQMSRWLLKFSVKCDKPVRFTLSLRVPEWAKGVELEVNGKNTAAPVKDGWLDITADWQNEFRAGILPVGSCARRPFPDMPELMSVVDGPIVLGGNYRQRLRDHRSRQAE